jgi:hypothetical protein
LDNFWFLQKKLPKAKEIIFKSLLGEGEPHQGRKGATRPQNSERILRIHAGGKSFQFSILFILICKVETFCSKVSLEF